MRRRENRSVEPVSLIIFFKSFVALQIAAASPLTQHAEIVSADVANVAVGVDVSDLLTDHVELVESRMAIDSSEDHSITDHIPTSRFDSPVPTDISIAASALVY